MPSAPAPPFTVLFVCTGNICRSAVAQQWGRGRLAHLFGPDAGDVRVLSAGTRAVVGSAMHPWSAEALRELGGDPDGFVARQLTNDDVRAADLVLTMTREHRQAVLAGSPRALARTFTLREAAELVGLLRDAELPGATLAERAPGLVAAMARARSRRAAGPCDDVADPIGRPIEAHLAAAEMIVEALERLLRSLASPLASDAPQPMVHPNA